MHNNTFTFTGHQSPSSTEQNVSVPPGKAVYQLSSCMTAEIKSMVFRQNEAMLDMSKSLKLRGGKKNLTAEISLIVST